LRVRAADGPDEQVHLGCAHGLPAGRVLPLVHRLEPGARHRPPRRPGPDRRHGPRAGRPPPEGEVRQVSLGDVTNDPGQPPQPPQPDAEMLLRRVVEVISNAKSLPLSTSVRIEKDEVLELLEEAVNRLPDELRQARWLLKERQEFLDK